MQDRKGKPMENEKIGARIEDIPEQENVILSQDGFDLNLDVVEKDGEGSRTCSERLFASHAALLDKVAELEKEIKNLTLKNESKFDAGYKSCYGNLRSKMDQLEERNNNLQNRIAELEKQIALSNAVVKQSSMAKNFESMQDKIADLEKQNAEFQARLAEFEPVVMDTRDEALDKLANRLMDLWTTGHTIEPMCDNGKRLKFKYENGGICGFERFPYAAPREPQPDDIYHVWDNEREVEEGKMRRLRRFDINGVFVGTDKHTWNFNKPTGYRWDTENQKIVPIRTSKK